MSSGMYGADMAQLRDLARRLQSASDQLNGSRQRIGSGIRIAAWMGPVAVRFRMLWDSEYSRQVQSASDALERISRDVLKQAEQQERASARDGGTRLGGGRPDGTTVGQISLEDFSEAIRALLGVHGLASDGAAYLKALQKIVDAGGTGMNSIDDVLKEFKSLGGVASAIGFLFNGWDLYSAVRDGDTGGQVEAALDTLAGVAGLFIPGAGLAWEGGKLIGTGIYQGVNTFYDSPGGALDQGARFMFGDSASFDTLTPEQHIRLAERYEGLGGFGLSIVDGVAGTTNDFFYWMGTKL
ncbi:MULTISPECIES: WXG100 family type VII secretion target [unclassified Rathayibacter]|uniref:WXG100 family type VII secretion target n=2 Tax=Rathayibacter TaxID=33886 RepID=UPI0011B0CEE7|nr:MULTISPECIES: WXG100 family type VII secretion target [unclassified Rathayibacter]